MGDLIPNEPPGLNTSPKSRMLKLSPFPSYSFTTQFAGMSTSSSPARRRATLTASQSFQHASNSYFVPEPHLQEDWVQRTTDTIPEASYSGSSVDSNSSPAIATPAAPIYNSHPPPSAQIALTPRSRANSFNTTSVHYSSAHRRVPSSPSFRSPSLSHTYFDRPPSPTYSISSRFSEPAMSGSLSLSELLAGNSAAPFDDCSQTPDDERVRREAQREERRLSMLERHSALIEQREKRRWSKTRRDGCVEWVENNSKTGNQS